MTRRVHGAVTSLYIYPDPQGPPQQVDEVDVGPHGLDGDRPKKAPVSVATIAEWVQDHPRANVIVDLTSAELDALVGHIVHVGHVGLRLTERKDSCGVMYAEVVQGGHLAPGDVVHTEK